MNFPTYKFETEKFAQGYGLIAGCDEVGIAPLAGPVVAAAVILDRESVMGRRSKTKWWYRVRDSKTVNEKERGVLVEFIKDHCVAHSVGVVTHETIDNINIYYAAMQAMHDAVSSLKIRPNLLFVDGNHKIKSLDGIRQEPVIGGDAKILSISAASIIAKVCRDEILNRMHEIYPRYNLHQNKGYPTKFHRMALVEHGASPIHRQSFNLVRLCRQRMLLPKDSSKI